MNFVTAPTHRSRPARLIVATLIALIGALALAACGGSSGTTTAKLPPVHPGRLGPEATFTPASSELLQGDVAAKLDLLRQLGVRDVHFGVAWAYARTRRPVSPPSGV